MYDIPTYNHSKPDVDSESKPSFFHYAAKISVFAPILSIIFAKSLEYGLKDIKSPIGLLIVAGLGLLLPLIYLVSIVLAVIALTGMSRHGTEGILRRSLSGLVLSALFLGIWTMGFVHGFQTAMQNRKAANAALQTTKDVAANEKKELAEKGIIGPESGQERAGKVKEAFDKMSKEMTGDNALVAKAMGAYTARANDLLTNYTTAALAIKRPWVLDMSGVKQREELAARKELVNKFMDANEKLLAFFTKAEDVFRNELARAKVPEPKREEALKGYRQTADERNFLTVKIRMTDQRTGTALLGMLDLLETNWGNWKYNPEKKNVIFQDTSVVAKYNEYFRNMNAASREAAQLQTELVNPLETASTQ